ncbi:mucin-2-like [Mytilus edulis]|uniref:mucin-2-like n=1 Tax=Mytilus edulis TaxID=6550 RepID=UPI0039EEF0CE
MYYFIPAQRVNFLLRHSKSLFHSYDIVQEEHKESQEYFSFTKDSVCCRASSFFKMFPSPGRKSRKSSPKSIGDMTLAQEKESTRTQPSPQSKEIIKSSPSPPPLDIEDVIKSFSSLNIDEQTTTPKVEKVTRMTGLTQLPPSQEVDIEAIETSLPVAVHIASPNIGHVGEMIISGTAFTTPGAIEIDTTTGAIEIDNITPGAIQIDTTTPRATEIDNTTPEAIQIDTSTPRAIKINTTTPRAIKIDTITPRANKIDTTTPRAIEIDTTTPRVIEIGTSTPRAIEIDTTTPRAIEIDTTTPRAIEIDTITPRAIEIDSTTYRAIEIDTSTPRAIKIGTTTRAIKIDTTTRAIEIDTTNPRAIEIDTTNPRAIEIDTTTPRAIKIDTSTSRAIKIDSSPRAIEIDTTTPRAIKIGTITPRAIQIDTTTPTAMEIDTSTPRAIKIGTITPRAIEIDTTTPRAIKFDTTTHAIDGHDRLKKKDKVLLDMLKKYNNEDADIDKLNKEMDAVNCLLDNIENDIDSLKAHKEMNQYLINKIMNVHKVIRNEKYCIQKQLESASRSCSRQNKRKSKEFDLLNIAYNKLDQKERSTRRRIASLKAELSLVISKLDMPKSKKEKPIVPPLDLSKLGERKVLPPLKNAPKASREGININSLAKENFTDYNPGNKRMMKAPEPKLSRSTPIMQNRVCETSSFCKR